MKTTGVQNRSSVGIEGLGKAGTKNVRLAMGAWSLTGYHVTFRRGNGNRRVKAHQETGKRGQGRG